MEDDEETMVINDLLSFLSCKSKVWPIVKLLEDVKNFYPEEEIIQAYRTLSESIKDSYVFNEIVTTGQDALKTIHSCFLSVNKDDLPVFVCRNIENIPELPSDEASSLSIPESSQKILEQALYKNHSKLKIDIAEVVSNVNKLSDNLRIFATKVTALSRQNTGTKKRSSLPLKAGQKSKTKAKSGLAHLQKLIDEERPNKRLIETGASEDRSSTDEELTGAIIDTQKLRAKGGIMPGVSTQQKRPSIVLQPETTPDYKSRIMAIRSPKKRGRHEVVADQKVLHIKSENDGIEVTLIKSEDDTSASMNELSESSLWSEDSCGQANDLMIKIEPMDASLEDDHSFTRTKGRQRKFLKSYSEDLLWLPYRKTNKCLLCLQKFEKEKEMNDHRKNCPAVSTKEEEFEPVEQHACPVCSVVFASVQSLMSHKAYHDPTRRFQCSDCDYRFYTREALGKHKKIHNTDLLQCPYCVYRTQRKSKLVTHIRVHTGFKPYECHLCDYRSISNYSLLYHIQRHNENQDAYECDFCDSKFKTKQRLKVHQNIHSDVRQFQCTCCSKTFKNSSTLKRHVTTHGDIRPYSCNVCTYKAKDIGTLQTHRNIHSFEKPFKCPICPFTSNQKGYLVTHIKSSHLSRTDAS